MVASPAYPLGPAVRRTHARERGFKYALVAPSIFVLLLIGIFPLVYLLVVSFQNITMIDVDTSFHGLLNYKLLSHDQRLWEALLHIVIFIVIALPVELILGLTAQLFIDRYRAPAVHAAGSARSGVPIVAGATWRLLFDNRYGPINQVVGWFAGEPKTLLWTINPDLVYRRSSSPRLAVDALHVLPLLAALSAVDKSQLEAASIDGAGYWRTFFGIVLPAIWPVMAVAILIRGLDLFRLFDVVWALTKGGPGTMTETISIFTYIKGFQQFETSYTAAVALLIIVLLSVLVFWGLKRVELAR
jgi:multiple sugar transport system permease protein